MASVAWDPLQPQLFACRAALPTAGQSAPVATLQALLNLVQCLLLVVYAAARDLGVIGSAVPVVSLMVLTLRPIQLRACH